MDDQQKEWEQSTKLLAEINRLTIAAFKANTLPSLIFFIVNDTRSVTRYDRALLWKIDGNRKHEILGVSGQATIKKNTELARKWDEVVQNITEPEKIQLIAHPHIPEKSSILWVPIMAHGEASLGLWLERWDGAQWNHEEIEILDFLLKGYGFAWEKITKGIYLSWLRKKPVLLSSLFIIVCLMFLRVPLRVVAPCEVVPEDPIVITTPLEGLIDKITVTPGEMVAKGTILFEYDKRVPLQDLRVAQKKVEISQAEVNRANSLSYSDKKALNDLGVETIKLKKERLDLELAEYHENQLEVKSPISGVVMMDSPEEWHGKSVHVGEKVMIVGDPNKTKVRLWIPEGDNIVIDMKKPIKIFLNIHPEVSEEAMLTYIANYTIVTDKSVTSFVAEAEWKDQDQDQDQNHPDVKLGLKGTAILYGEKVSVFYWIIRKPLAYVRTFIGY